MQLRLNLPLLRIEVDNELAMFTTVMGGWLVSSVEKLKIELTSAKLKLAELDIRKIKKCGEKGKTFSNLSSDASMHNLHVVVRLSTWSYPPGPLLYSRHST